MDSSLSISLFAKLPFTVLVAIIDFIKQTGPLKVSYDFNKQEFMLIENPIYQQYKILLQTNGLELNNIEEKDQTLELCEIAVKECGLAIKYVKNQTPELCKLAIEQFPFAIKFITVQTEDLCLPALSKSGLTIKNIHNPTEKMYQYAVNKCGYAIEHIKNPSDKVKQIAALRNGCKEYDLEQWKYWNY